MKRYDNQYDRVKKVSDSDVIYVLKGYERKTMKNDLDSPKHCLSELHRTIESKHPASKSVLLTLRAGKMGD